VKASLLRSFQPGLCLNSALCGVFCGLFESSALVVIVREAGACDDQGAEWGAGGKKAQEIDGTRFGEYAKKMLRRKTSDQ
jgi:hypothetical protein